MAYSEFSAGLGNNPGSADAVKTLAIHGDSVDLPDASFVKDADMARDGADLVLQGPDGTVVIEGYFTADPAPNLVAPDGSTLTPQLVESFTAGDSQYASNMTANDVSPVGAVQEVSGKATVTHPDGTSESIVIGTPIYEGDVVETDASGAVNIVFADQTSFAVSEDARLAVDKYVYDPSTQAGETDFSLLKGVFVFTSGLIGREDPDDVKIDTPAGSIGIRGTIIAGNLHTGEITVVEGAIVLHDFAGNEVTLANQFETARFTTNGGGIEHMGQISASDITSRFSSVSSVTPSFFSNINQNAVEDAPANDAPATDAPVEAPANNAAPTEDHSMNTAPATTTNSGFGNTSGFAPGTLGGTASFVGPLGHQGPVAGLSNPPGPLPPPPPPAEPGSAASGGTHPPLHDPGTEPPPPNGNNTVTPPANSAPFALEPTVHVSPSEAFEASETNIWHYNFAKEFGDTNIASGDTLHFELDAATITQLNALTKTVPGGDPDALSSAAGDGLMSATGDESRGWTFNEATGLLTLHFYNTMDNAVVTQNDFFSFDIGIRAVDSAGLSTTTELFEFKVYNAFSSLSAGFGTFSTDSEVRFGSTAASTGTLVGDNGRFYFNNNDDMITVDYMSGSNSGSNNVVNLGNGNNLLTLENDAFNNVLVAGAGGDIFVLRNVDVKAFGGDGDDTFILDYSNENATTLYKINNQLAANNGIDIDGGHSHFRAAAFLDTLGLNTHGTTGGRGDTLQLLGAGSLDFSTFDSANQISGIERIDMVTSTASQAVTLQYSDVLNLTDGQHGHTLIINVGAGDTLNLTGSQFNTANMQRVRDDISIDDGAEGSVSMKSFDVFTDGNVTLLIHNAGGVVNMDGASVTI